MKLKFNIHSWISLITNSSSEIFVATTDKSQETVREILEELLRMYNKKLEWAGNSDKQISSIDNILSYWVSNGKVEIYSLDDNSIPYSLMEDIKNIFNATQTHY